MAVTFTSATTRRTWQASLLVSALWVAIAIGIGHAIAGTEAPWILSAIIYGAFIALSVVWWLARALVQWLVWRVIWRKASINNLVAVFEKHRFPKPPASLLAPENWFADIAFGEDAADLTVEQRMAAGAHYIRIAEFAVEQGFIASLRTRATYEEAIAAYRSTFPRQDR